MRLFPRALFVIALTGVLACSSAGTRLTQPLDQPVWARAKPAVGPALVVAAAASRPRSYVVLLPDVGGGVGEIEVRGGEETVTLNTPNQGVDLEDPMHTFAANTYEMEPFSSALAIEPPAPLYFSILFESTATQPTAEAVALVQSAIDRIKGWPAPEIIITGYTDREGGVGSNQELSRRRAEAVRALLEGQGIKPESVEVRAFGETRQAVATPDGVAEARNRRVKISVR